MPMVRVLGEASPDHIYESEWLISWALTQLYGKEVQHVTISDAYGTRLVISGRGVIRP